MSNLDRMRQAAANRPEFKPKPPPPPKKPDVPKPPPVEKVRMLVECVKHKCGCEVTAALYRSQNCTACINKYRRERAEKKRAKVVPTGTGIDMGGQVPGRLPVGAVKTMHWNGTVWMGVMVLPGVPEEFRVQEDTEKKCLQALHTAYMKWFTQQPKPETTLPTE